MKYSTGIGLAWLMSTPVLAQELTDDSSTEEESAPTEDAVQVSLEAIEAELNALKASSGIADADREKAEALLLAASNLMDPESELDIRTAGAVSLGESQDARALSFLRRGIRDSSTQVRLASYRASVGFTDAEGMAIGVWGLEHEELEELTEAAAQVLVAQANDAAAMALFQIAESTGVSDAARSSAYRALEASYSEFLAAQGPPAAVSDVIGRGAFSLANGVLGGFSLGTVGTFGQDDVAIGIGAVGGSVIGAGGSWLVSADRPVTQGQGLAYLSTSTWGLVGGQVFADLVAPELSFGNRDGKMRFYSVLRTAGGLGGAALGWKALNASPTVEDTVEVNLTTYLGMQTAIGMVDVFNQPTSNDPGQSWYERRYQMQRAAGLLGAGAGAAIGYKIRETWEIKDADLAFAMVAGAEGTFLGFAVPEAYMGGYRDGGLRLGSHLSAAAGLLYSHHRPVTLDQTYMAAWNAGHANLIAGGVGLFADMEEESIIGLMAPLGLAGLGYGTWLGEDYELTLDDQVLVGIGTGFGAWNSAMLTSLLVEADAFSDDDQPAGLAMVGIGLSGLGSAYLAKRTEIDWNYTTFIGTSTAWGAFYAVTGLLATGIEDAPAEVFLGSILAASDLAAGFAAWAGSEQGFIDPSQTGIATLGGLTGATLGSLAVLMASDEGQAVAIGAMAGATLGIAGGAYLTPKFQGRSKRVAKRWSPINPPGEWSFSLTPALMENGEIGAQVGLQGFGF